LIAAERLAAAKGIRGANLAEIAAGEYAGCRRVEALAVAAETAGSAIELGLFAAEEDAR
jgi:hypothetical protein